VLPGTVADVTEFLLELYVSRGDSAAAERGAEQARLGAEALVREGVPVRYLGSMFVPEDETCFYLYEAPSADAVREAARRGQLAVARVVRAIVETPLQL
jgi:Nickel responsive protein SCO4226-like